MNKKLKDTTSSSSVICVFLWLGGSALEPQKFAPTRSPESWKTLAVAFGDKSESVGCDSQKPLATLAICQDLVQIELTQTEKAWPAFS